MVSLGTGEAHGPRALRDQQRVATWLACSHAVATGVLVCLVLLFLRSSVIACLKLAPRACEITLLSCVCLYAARRSSASVRPRPTTRYRSTPKGSGAYCPSRSLKCKEGELAKES